jgi:16S rRNA C967 or C1407 C5-methylase (RsmB/RsmF family)
MSHTHTLTKGKSAFLEYYSHLLPQFANIELLESYLTLKNTPVLLISPLHYQEVETLWKKHHLVIEPLSWFPQAWAWPSQVQVGTTLPGFREGWVYPLNRSSLLPVLALNPKPQDTILDACAAPGGKTIAISTLLKNSISYQVANDASFPRFKRLKTTLKFMGLSQITTSNYSVQALAHTSPTTFNKILLDAPCSSEKHVFNSKRHLKIWSPNRIDTLSHLQELLITSLIPLLNPGGTLIYSTCALTPTENEQVVANILKSTPLTPSPLPTTLPLISPGLLNLGLNSNELSSTLRVNTTNNNYDPMFIASFTKSP